MTYTWRNGFRAHEVKAAVAAAELDRIRTEKGTLTAEATLEAARPKTAVLHPEFVWDGKEAVRELGLIRARQLIRSVVIITEGDTEPAAPVYVHVPPAASADERAGTYELLSVVVQHEDQFDRALRALHGHVEAAERSVRELERAAQGAADGDKLARISLAVAATSALREAIAAIRG